MSAYQQPTTSATIGDLRAQILANANYLHPQPTNSFTLAVAASEALTEDPTRMPTWKAHLHRTTFAGQMQAGRGGMQEDEYWKGEGAWTVEQALMNLLVVLGREVGKMTGVWTGENMRTGQVHAKS